MRLTIYNFIMSFLWCNICIILFVALRRRHRFISRHGIAPLFVLLLFGLVRFFVTVEFPFTMIFRSTSVFPAIQGAVRHPSWVSGLTYGWLLVAVWAAVSVALLVKMIIGIVRQNIALASIEQCDNTAAAKILDRLLAETKVQKKCGLVVSPDIGLPIVTGFFSPTIFLPEMEIAESDLKYILLHELSHFANRDAWLKLFIIIFRAVFWWNPLVYTLEKDLSFILEIQSDSTATKHLSQYEKTSYAQSIVNFVKRVHISEIQTLRFASGIAGQGRSERIHERLGLLLSAKRCSAKAVVLIAATLRYLDNVQHKIKPKIGS